MTDKEMCEREVFALKIMWVSGHFSLVYLAKTKRFVECSSFSSSRIFRNETGHGSLILMLIT